MENNSQNQNPHEDSQAQGEMPEDHLRFVELQMLIERANEETRELQQLRKDDQITPDFHRDRIDALTYHISAWENELNSINEGGKRSSMFGRAVEKLFRKHPPSE